MPRPILIAALGLCAGLLAAPGVAQEKAAVQGSTCGQRDFVAGYLKDRFDEVPVSLGLQPDGRMMQLFASEKTGTWSLVTTTPAGLSCIMAIGDAWQDVPHGPVA